MTLKLCEDITLVFGHVSSLAANLFGDTSSFKDWHFVKEYGGESGRDIRRWDKDYDVKAKAGEVLGTVGGNPPASGPGTLPYLTSVTPLKTWPTPIGTGAAFLL